MGLFSSIGDFFGGDAKQDAADRQSWRMGAYRSQALKEWSKSLDYLKGQYAKSRAEYRANYKKTLSDYTGMVSSARGQMEAGFGREMGYLGEGKEGTLQQVQQAYEKSRGETMAGNIMSGLSGTSFGAGQMQSLRREEGQQLGNVETAYAQRFASTEARQTQQRGAFNMANIAGRTALRSGYQAGRENQRRGWAGMISGAYKGRANAMLGWGDVMQQAGQGQMAAEQGAVDTGLGIFGNILGGIF